MRYAVISDTVGTRGEAQRAVFVAELRRLSPLMLRILDELELARGHGGDPGDTERGWSTTRDLASWSRLPSEHAASLVAPVGVACMSMHRLGFVDRMVLARGPNGSLVAWRISRWAEARGMAARLTLTPRVR
jgi:hypothetical protein